MTMIRVQNRTRGTLLGTRVRLADRLPSRTRGFLFRPAPTSGEGILLSPCRAVHMYGMRFPLDVLFISEAGQVVATYRELRPWQRSRVHGSAAHALELPPGTIRATGTAVGDLLSWSAAVEADGGLDAAAAPGAGRTASAAGEAADGNGRRRSPRPGSPAESSPPRQTTSTPASAPVPGPMQTPRRPAAAEADAAEANVAARGATVRADGAPAEAPGPGATREKA
jgi:uncharacterized protein